MSEPCLIALDWGTTNLRAGLLGARGCLLQQRSAPAGLLHLQDRRFERSLLELCGDWMSDPALPLLASGMVGSRQGWVEAPYLELPARLTDAAAGLATVALQRGGVLHIVPGVCRRSGGGDVMRGEETQLWGAGLPDGACCVLPGTHSKWVWMTGGGAIGDFSTCVTGELYALLGRHSTLGRLLPETPSPRPQAFAQGVHDVLADPACLTQLLFGVRAGVLLAQLGPHDAAERLSGLLIGAELAAARSRTRVDEVWLLGEASVLERYRSALALAGMASRPVVEGAAWRGLWALASAAGLVRSAR